MEETSSDEDSGKHKAPLERFANVEPGPLPPIAPDGGFAPGPVGTGIVVPPATPENFACLRGPCRYYWEMQTFFASGNPAETWGDDGLKDEHGDPIRAPRSISRTCLAHPGTETDLTDDAVYECSRWDPLTPREKKAREKRIKKYLKNAQHNGGR